MKRLETILVVTVRKPADITDADVADHVRNAIRQWGKGNNEPDSWEFELTDADIKVLVGHERRPPEDRRRQ
jgi:hypothetical protein